jgi:hypothetical protein
MWQILSPNITLGPGTGTSYTNKIILPVLDSSLYIKCEKSVIQDWKNEEEFWNYTGVFQFKNEI